MEKYVELDERSQKICDFWKQVHKAKAKIMLLHVQHDELVMVQAVRSKLNAFRKEAKPELGVKDTLEDRMRREQINRTVVRKEVEAFEQAVKARYSALREHLFPPDKINLRQVRDAKKLMVEGTTVSRVLGGDQVHPAQLQSKASKAALLQQIRKQSMRFVPAGAVKSPRSIQFWATGLGASMWFWVGPASLK